MSKKISVADLLKAFQFTIINKGTPSKNFITSSGVARIGLDLATNLKPWFKKQTNIVCFGQTELMYFKQLPVKTLKKVFAKVKKLNPPMIILNQSWKDTDKNKFMKAMGKTNITIAWLNMNSTSIYFELSPFVAKLIAPSEKIHGTLMSIYGVGTLILGDSGCGKSEAAMELIKAGHLFVADDAVEVYNFGRSLYGHSSEVAKHFMEVRGLGILNIARMFGKQKTLRETTVEVIIHLVSEQTSKEQLNKFERVGNKQHYETIRGVKIPKYYIPITAGRPTSSLIESAVADYKLKAGGYNSGEEYLQNFNKVLRKAGK